MAALAADNEGHQVTLFLEGNGTNILNVKAGEIVVKDNGDLYELLENLKIQTLPYVSEMSAKSRVMISRFDIRRFAMPNVLIEESIKVDSILCY